MGTAGELHAMITAALALTAPFWTSSDDQSVYATWYLFRSAALNATVGFPTGAAAGASTATVAAAGPAAALAAGPPIKLDACQDVFSTLSGGAATGHRSIVEVSAEGAFTHRLTGARPLVAHLPGRSRRFKDFIASLPRP